MLRICGWVVVVAMYVGGEQVVVVALDVCGVFSLDVGVGVVALDMWGGWWWLLWMWGQVVVVVPDV